MLIFVRGTYKNLQCAFTQSMYALIIIVPPSLSSSPPPPLLLKNIIIYVYEDTNHKSESEYEKSRHKAYGINVKKVKKSVRHKRER